MPKSRSALPSPPTLPGYVVVQALGQTRQIAVLVSGRVTQTITDPARIQTILAVVGAPDHAPPPGVAAPASIHLVFSVGGQPYRVVLIVSSQRGSVTVYNAHRPDHMVAEYPVSATFGAALAAAIGQAPPRP